MSRNRVIRIVLCLLITLLSSMYVYASELPSIHIEKESSAEESWEQNATNNKDKEKEDSEGIGTYIVIGVVSVIAVASIIINIVLITNRKKQLHMENNDRVIIEINNVRVEEKVGPVKEYKRKPIDAPVTTMLWKILIQVVDKKNNLRYEVKFDSSHENLDIKLGRGERAKVDMKIPLPNISDEHCVIQKRGQDYFLKDLNSTNGTKYENEIVTESMKIKDKGKLCLGKSEFELLIVDKQM